MSSAVITEPGMRHQAAAPPRGMLRQVLGDTLVRWGAKLGVAWIIALAFFAVFAPIIANSHPVAVKMDGRWSSPMLQHLSAVDVTLLAVTFVGLVLVPLQRVSLKMRWGMWLGVLVLAAVVSGLTVRPPSVIVYEKWREAQAMGQVERVIHAPIPYSPSDRLRDRGAMEISGPWWAGYQHNHWLGQDPLQQDIASRMIHASRIALAVGFIATGIAMTLGILIGAPMGYFAGVLDLIEMRVVEVFEFIPTLFLLLMFVAFFERNIYMIMAIIGFTSWAGYARFVRAEFLKLRNQDFVQAARACGLPLWSVLFRHMLPNGLAPVLVNASFGVASAILAEATLSFLGLGLIEEPSWGQLLNQAVRAGSFIWWIAVFPGAAIFLTVFAYNLVGEALRDAIDPHTRRASQL